MTGGSLTPIFSSQCELTIQSKVGAPLVPSIKFPVNIRRRMKRVFDMNYNTIGIHKIYFLVETRGNVLHIDAMIPKLRTIISPNLAPALRPLETKEPPKRNLQLNINLSQVLRNLINLVNSELLQVGVSLVSDRRREELLFAEVTQCNVVFLQREEDQLFDLRLTDIQIDSQLVSPNSIDIFIIVIS